MVHRPRLSLSPAVMLLLALALFLLPLKYLLSWLVAVAVHELCHYLALKLCGCHILQIKIGLAGAQIQTEPLSAGQELLCAAAGPLGSLLLMLLIRMFPLVALCGLVQGLYNLLPIYPMDGGRMLYGALRIKATEAAAQNILRYAGAAVRWLLAAGLVFVYLRWPVGFHPLIAAVFLLLKRKIPCKEQPLWDQCL